MVVLTDPNCNSPQLQAGGSFVAVADISVLLYGSWSSIFLIFTTAMCHNMQTSIQAATNQTVDAPACGKVRAFVHCLAACFLFYFQSNK